ncbi:MAG: acyl-CoA dehydrogenase family protein, partial [Pseudomonadota bacterium]
LFTAEIADRATEAENARNYPQDLVDRMAEAGLYRLCNPRALGGLEGSAADYARAVERLARADGSAGWVIFIGITSMVTLAHFPPDVAGAMLAAPDTKAAGVFAPRGRAQAVTVDGQAGFLLSGQWQWGSGSQNCDWLSCGGFVTDAGGQLVMLDNGRPDQRAFALRREQVTFIDTWDVSGLRGTGSTDFKVDNVFVPEAYARRVFDPAPGNETIYAFPTFGFLAVGIAAVALGIARAAIDELLSFAGAKTPEGSRRKLAQKSATQRAVAEAEALVRAARLFFYDAIETAWAEAEQMGAATPEARRNLRLAMTHTVRACSQAVTKMYETGGGTSVYRTSRLQRHFRDIHVATQHMMVSPDIYELTGRLFLDVETDISML